MSDEPAVPIPSATVMLLRDGASGVEVFMVQRNAGIDFAGGALVYPGGKSDAADFTEDTAAFCDGVSSLALRDVGNRVCGIRETFEEAGFLLAREKGSGSLVLRDRCLQLGQQYRDAVHSGELTMRDLAAQENLILACDLMVPFARWITPTRSPKRYDTWFFLARAPEGQLGSHDQTESVDSLWISPDSALKGASENIYNIVFATRSNLMKVGRAADVADALETAQRDQIVTVEPEITELDDDRISFKIPREAGYGFSEQIEKNGPTVVQRAR